MSRTVFVMLGTALAVSAALPITEAPLLAHHGRGATYDLKKEVRIKGVVTEFSWRNPHALVYMDVKDAKGKVQNWAFEAQNLSSLSRIGLNRTSLRPG